MYGYLGGRIYEDVGLCANVIVLIKPTWVSVHNYQCRFNVASYDYRSMTYSTDAVFVHCYVVFML